MLGGAAPNYRCYRCADGNFVAVGPLEPNFHKAMLGKLGLPEKLPRTPEDQQEEIDRLTETFAAQPRAHWDVLFAGTDGCVTGVLSLNEAMTDPHMTARGVYVEVDGWKQPAPAPRFSRTPGQIQGAAPQPDEGGRERLAAWGVVER